MEDHIYIRKLGQAPRELTYDLNFVRSNFDKWRFRKSKDRISVLFDVEIPITYGEIYPGMKFSNDYKKNFSEQFELKFTKEQLMEFMMQIPIQIEKLNG